MVPGTNDDQQKLTEAFEPGAAEELLTDEDRALLKKYSDTFIGSYAHSLDAKGRLVVPLAFRERTSSPSPCIPR